MNEHQCAKKEGSTKRKRRKEGRWGVEKLGTKDFPIVSASAGNTMQGKKDQRQSEKKAGEKEDQGVVETNTFLIKAKLVLAIKNAVKNQLKY